MGPFARISGGGAGQGGEGWQVNQAVKGARRGKQRGQGRGAMIPEESEAQAVYDRLTGKAKVNWKFGIRSKGGDKENWGHRGMKPVQGARR